MADGAALAASFGLRTSTTTISPGSASLAPRLRGTHLVEGKPGIAVHSSSDGPADRRLPRRLLEWKELPAWRQRGSNYLLTGYRPATTSLADCLQSWTYLHNETVNIFSHFFGALLFMCLPLYVFGTEIPPRFRVATPTDVLVCCVYFTGVAACFVLSTAFHTFMAHSPAAYATGVKLDYAGILLLMWSSTLPLAYYSFPCQAGLQMAYWAMTTLLALLSLFAACHPSIDVPQLGHIRAILFGSFGFGSFLVPIMHGIVKYGLAEQSARIGLPWIAVTAVCNGLGVMAYGCKVPERWFPKTFDIWGASHQVMHIMVLCAALTYTCALLQAFDYHHARGNGCDVEAT